MRFVPKEHLDIAGALLGITRNQDLTHNEKSILSEILYRCYDKDHCWPSQSNLAESTGLKQPNVARAVASLKRKRMVETVLDGRKLKYYILAHYSHLKAAKKKPEFVTLCAQNLYHGDI